MSGSLWGHEGSFVTECTMDLTICINMLAAVLKAEILYIYLFLGQNNVLLQCLITDILEKTPALPDIRYVCCLAFRYHSPLVCHVCNSLASKLFHLFHPMLWILVLFFHNYLQEDICTSRYVRCRSFGKFSFSPQTQKIPLAALAHHHIWYNSPSAPLDLIQDGPLKTEVCMITSLWMTHEGDEFFIQWILHFCISSSK